MALDNAGCHIFPLCWNRSRQPFSHPVFLLSMMWSIYKKTETENDVQNHWGKTTAFLKIGSLPEALTKFVRSCKPHTDHGRAFYTQMPRVDEPKPFALWLSSGQPTLSQVFMCLFCSCNCQNSVKKKSSKKLENEALCRREQIHVKFYNFHTACDRNELNCT